MTNKQEQQGTIEVEGGYQFGRIPKALLHDPLMSANSIRLYGLLDELAGGKRSAFPGQEWLAERMNVSVKTVQRAFKELEKGGFARRAQRGFNQSNRYFLYPNANAEQCSNGTPVSTIGGHPCRPGCDTSDRLDATPMTALPRPIYPDLINQNKTEPSGQDRPDQFEEEFEELWKSYPRKKARKPALTAYIARRRDGVSFEDLRKATEHYAAETVGSDLKFIMHGSTFYGSNERWADYVKPPPTDPQQNDWIQDEVCYPL